MVENNLFTECKKFFGFIILLVLLVSCESIIDNMADNLVDSNGRCPHPHETYVVGVNGEHHIKAGEALHLEVDIALNPCAVFRTFARETDGNITVFTPEVCGECGGKEQVQSVNLIIQENRPGTYLLHFKEKGNSFKEFRLIVQ